MRFRVCLLIAGLSVVAADASTQELEALAACDTEKLTSLETVKLNSGTSEIRNWIAMYGATEHLISDWYAYLPAYRTAAGTRTGCGFGVWK